MNKKVASRTTGQRKDGVRAGADRVPPWCNGCRKDRILAGGDRVPPWTTALITGASSGIGEALARNLAARGVHVILAARRMDLLKTIAMEIQSSGGQATALRLDVAKADLAAKTIAALDQKFGGIDLVIANAGVGIRQDPSYDWTAVKKVADINYTGALATITTLLPAMVKRKQGHVVAISSLAGFTALPDAAGYSSPKAGLSRFMECLALDLQNTGVSVSTVHVGFVKTPMVAQSTIPLPFLISAEDAAEYIVRGLIQKKREINFPKPMVALIRLLSWLPFWVKKLVARQYWKNKTRG